jgi:hypothetical protein
MLDDDEMNRLAEQSNVHLFSSLSVNWGGLTQVLCTLEMIKKANELFPFAEWIHLISGSHIPLKNNSYLDSFFENTPFMGFMEVSNLLEEKLRELVEKRMCIYHFNDIHDRRNHNVVGAILRITESVENAVLNANVRIRKPISFKYAKGSQWFSWKKELLDYVLAFLNENDWYLNRFRYTSCCDEIFFHIILRNSMYWTKICKKNYLYVDWTHLDPGEHAPHTLQLCDYSRMSRNAEWLFARKIDPVKSKQLIDKIIMSRG